MVSLSTSPSTPPPPRQLTPFSVSFYNTLPPLISTSPSHTPLSNHRNSSHLPSSLSHSSFLPIPAFPPPYPTLSPPYLTLTPSQHTHLSSLSHHSLLPITIHPSFLHIPPLPLPCPLSLPPPPTILLSPSPPYSASSLSMVCTCLHSSGLSNQKVKAGNYPGVQIRVLRTQLSNPSGPRPSVFPFSTLALQFNFEFCHWNGMRLYTGFLLLHFFIAIQYQYSLCLKLRNSIR